jgi:hypothetical protein
MVEKMELEALSLSSAFTPKCLSVKKVITCLSLTTLLLTEWLDRGKRIQESMLE